ncbi:hypothetical protein KEM55_009351 [Ascosphaera atra]|nr:hypothetical protein KEM55_009351 [Ascosphaera atra]
MVSKFSEMTTANPPLYELPPEALAELPSSIPFPAFLGDTDASHKLRGAYVQHIVYKILTRRIFEPFLLTIRGKQDEAGMLLATLASDMRKKSVRREALWRQLTVKTAYSTAGASQQHKAILRHVRDEILRKVVPFVNPDPEEMTMEGVKDMATQLVGAAIETWRYARTERESITAIMPPVEEVIDNGDWRDFDDVFNQAATRQLSQHREVLLRVAPRIYREPAHEDFFQDLSPERAKALSKECTYLPGTNLYADSPCLVARYAELPGSKGDFRMLRTAEKLAPSPLKPSRSVKEPNGNGRPQLLEWHS